MKTAIYIEDGVVQLVITPESDFEKSALAAFNKDGASFKFMRGQFYPCQGGWIRHAEQYHSYGYPHENKRDDSLIIRMNHTPEIPE